MESRGYYDYDQGIHPAAVHYSCDDYAVKHEKEEIHFENVDLEEGQMPKNETQYRKWLVETYKPIFKPFESSGGIPKERLVNYLSQDSTTRGLRKGKLNKFMEKIDRNQDGRISFKEFFDGMITKRKEDLSKTQRVLDYASRAVAPQMKKYHKKLQEAEDEKYGSDQLDGEFAAEAYMDAYNCMPPPICIPLLVVIQIVVFAVYAVQVSKKNELGNQLTWMTGAPYWSPLMFNTYYRSEVWRYVTYMFLHKGYQHLIVNVLFELLLGIPLELVHKFYRVFPLFLAGVLGGSLASSIFDSTTKLCGSSGGAYALIGAHFAIVFMNWEELQHDWLKVSKRPMRFIFSGVCRLCVLTVMVCVEFGSVIYQRYTSDEKMTSSYIAHIGGLLCGVLLGVPLLKNLDKKPWENYLFWFCLIGYTVFLVFGVFWNVFYQTWSLDPALEPKDP